MVLKLTSIMFQVMIFFSVTNEMLSLPPHFPTEDLVKPCAHDGNDPPLSV